MTADSVVDRYYAAWSAGDTDAIAAIVLPEVTGHSGSSPFGRDDLLTFRAALSERYADLTIRTREQATQDDRVATAWTTHAVRNDGVSVELHGISMYRIADGRIAEIWDVRGDELPVLATSHR